MHSATSDPQSQHLILLGGGHSHALLIRMLAMRPLPGVRITLVSEGSTAPYSGMLPGYIAGAYSWDEMHIDLRRLCAAAGVVFVRGMVDRLDADTRTVFIRGRPSMAYDALSINTGGAPALAAIPGAAENAIPVKPVPQLLEGWDRIQAGARLRPVRVVVIGGGAGGAELALCMQHQLQGKAGITIVHRGESLLEAHPAKVRSIISRVVQEKGIKVITAASVTSVRTDGVSLSGTSPQELEADFVICATPATPPSWLASGGLALDGDGSVRISRCLQSTSHPNVFAAGDVASFPGHLPRSGVYAVRMARPLADNLRRFFAGTALRPYRPQKAFLSLIGTADGRAVASRRPFAMHGAWLWRLKDSIDRRFMNRFRKLPVMKLSRKRPALPGSLEEKPLMRCRGCAAKIGSGILTTVLARLTESFADVIQGGTAKGILTGLDSPDDAAVLQLPPGRLLVQTVDYLPALMDDPFVFGQVAALHSFSDLFAMGAEPHSCLATALVPFGGASLSGELLYQLLAGVLTVLRECGAQLLGGHTAEGSPMALTLMCNGLAGPGEIMTKGGLRSGEVLILTKALGIGTLYAAAMRGVAKPGWLDAAERSMCRSNLPASRIFRAHGVRGCTDVTGFGLAGHLQEMVHASRCGVRIPLDSIPLLEGALEVTRLGVRSSLYQSNAAFLESAEGPVPHQPHFPLVFDPQTSGGLLAGVPVREADSCLRALRQAGYPEAAIIGRVEEQTPAQTPALLWE